MQTIVVSNRLPVTIQKKGSAYDFHQSDGGLVSSIGSYMSKQNSAKHVWVGWTGSEVVVEEQNRLEKKIKELFNYAPVFLEENIANDFYQGFCNKIVWPLFHNFTTYCDFKERYWETYKTVNTIFAEKVLEIAKPHDTILVQDYHLMLLPELLRKAKIPLSIGFFLHIPFPTYDIYKLLPKVWRGNILRGLLGADVVGFHTNDYTSYFLESTKRVLEIQNIEGCMKVDDRVVKAHTIPLGIDFNKYHNAPKKNTVIHEKKKLEKIFKNKKIILSIDRLDYTKGIINRLEGLEEFLIKNPDYHKKFIFVLVAIPSRTDVDQYQILKHQVDEYIGRINGKFGTFDWNPIRYMYSSISFEELSALYYLSDIALVTPLKDGMNLIAKEFIATKRSKKGVLILSEMAGAAEELTDSLIVNPNSREEIAAALQKAFTMPVEEQKERISKMQNILKEKNVYTWMQNFTSLMNEKQTTLENYNKDFIFPWYYTASNSKNKNIVFQELQMQNIRKLFIDKKLSGM